MRELDHLLEMLKPSLRLADAERHGAERYAAPRFSVLDIIDTKETALSRIIAYLLDPSEAHGQGFALLTPFLNAIGLPVKRSNEMIHVRCESATSAGRRIDVVIESPSVVVGIENKPYAGEGINQLRDYLLHIRSIAHKRDARLVFLSNVGPSLADPGLMHIAFTSQDGIPALTEILTASLPNIRAPQVKAFVIDFRDWIERRFGQANQQRVGMSSHIEAVLKTAFDNVDNRKAIGAILLAQEEIRRHVVDEIGSVIFSAVSARYPDAILANTRSLSKVLAEPEVAWGIRRPSWPENCLLAIEAERNGARGIGYGVLALDPDSPDAAEYPDRASSRIDELTRLVQTVPFSETPAEWWRWSKYANVRDWTASYTAKLLVESDGRIDQHPDINDMIRNMFLLAERISELSD